MMMMMTGCYTTLTLIVHRLMTRQIGSPRSIIADSVITDFFRLCSRDFDVIADSVIANFFKRL
jgi:hypothetical protein